MQPRLPRAANGEHIWLCLQRQFQRAHPHTTQLASTLQGDHDELAVMLISKGGLEVPSSNESDSNGWTLLHIASQAGKVENVSIILQFIDDESYVNARTSEDEDGVSALWLAKQGDHDEVAGLLISKGGLEVPLSNESDSVEDVSENNLDEHNEADDLPFDDQSENDFVEGEVSKENTSYDGKKEQSYDTANGDSVDGVSTFTFEETSYVDKLGNEAEEIEVDVDIVLEGTSGSDGKDEQTKDSLNEISAKTVKPFTFKEAVHVALHQSPMLLSILTKNPEHIEATDSNGWTLLHEVSRAGNAESVSIILQFIDNVSYLNARTSEDDNGVNALWLAKQGGHDEISEILISKGGLELPSQNNINIDKELGLENAVIYEAEELKLGEGKEMIGV